MAARKVKMTTSRTHEESAGVIPVLHKNKKPLFLVVQHRVGHWGFPKGHIEKGEGARQTALRELREETGIILKSLGKRYFKDTYTFKREGTKCHKTVTYYLGNAQNARVYLQKSEIRNYHWLPYRDAHTRLSYSGSRRALTVLAKGPAVESPSVRIVRKENPNAERSLYRRRRNRRIR